MEIIWGITIQEIILLVKQVGLATAGAATLWGFVFSVRDIRLGKPEVLIVDDWLSVKIFNLFLGALLVAFTFYIISMPAISLLAHEGISVAPTPQEIISTFPLLTPLNLILLAITIGMIFLRSKSPKQFSYLITPFYAVAFVLIFVIISLPGWRGSLDPIQIFHFLHGSHSIFTVGSVIVLDFLFVISSRSDILKQHVYPMFPAISKVIWVGLSLDFISVFLITDHFAVTEKLLFTQTIIGVLIINGVLLSGPIARRMIASVTEGGEQVEERWRKAGDVAGAISITSWLAITSLDFFRELTLGYGALSALYLGFLTVALLGHFLFDKLLDNLSKNKTVKI